MQKVIKVPTFNYLIYYFHRKEIEEVITLSKTIISHEESHTKIFKYMTRYAHKKFVVFPVCSHDHEAMSNSHTLKCTSLGKAPLIKGYTNAQVPSDDQISDWEKKFPNSNIGMSLGGDSNIIRIDIDGEDGLKLFEEMCIGEMPITPTFNTPTGGKGILLKIPEGIETHKFSKSLPGKDHQGLEILTTGQHTVLPPSIHNNGSDYRWVKGKSILNIDIALAPEWVINLISTKKSNIAPVVIEKDTSNLISPLNKIENLAKHCKVFDEVWEEQKASGADEESWFRFDSLFVNANCAETAYFFSETSSKHNEHSNQRIADLIKSDRKGMVKCTSFGCNEEAIKKCQNKLRYASNNTIKNSPGYFIKKYNRKLQESLTSDKVDLTKIGFIFDEDGCFKSINGNLFAKFILDNFQIAYTSGNRFYIYTDGVYKLLEKNQLSRKFRNFLHQFIPDIWTANLETIYINALGVESPLITEMDQDHTYLNLPNGLFNINTFELVSHTPEFYSSIRIPITYNPDAICPKFEKFLDEIFSGDKELISLVQEVFGYCLTSENKAQKSFILYGNGSNGKSLLLSILRELVGKENTASLSLTDLDNAFNRYYLINKTVNLLTENEMSASGLNTQYFKAIVSGDPITVEKKFGEAFSYSPICKILIALNNLFYSKDKSFGFQRRLIILPFLVCFDDEKADKTLFDKLIDEMPGILNFSLLGLKRLRKNNFVFSYSKACLDVLEDYKKMLNPIYAFVEDEIEVVPLPGRVEYGDLKRRFSNWCKKNNHKNLENYSMSGFLKSIKNVLIENNMDIGKPQKSDSKTYLCGISLKDTKTDSVKNLLDLDD